MEDYTLPFWIYLAVLTVFVGGAMKKLLASQLSAAPSLVAWLGATVLVERVWALCLPAVLLLLLLLACFLYFRTRPPPAALPARGKAVLITGCDSGFGNATAKRLDALGFEVFATVLDPSGDGARDLLRTCSPRLTVLQVDITQQQQVQQALLDTQAKLGPKGLWALVNNAGVCVNFGDSELSLMENFRGCMEVNFFGTLSVTRSFLPLLRQTRGRIITISSPAGDQPFPCLAAYGASKAALNLLTNTLRHELEPWGVKVSTVLPSSFRTGCRGSRCSRTRSSTFITAAGSRLELKPPDDLRESERFYTFTLNMKSCSSDSSWNQNQDWTAAAGGGPAEPEPGLKVL
ncbi:11-beta-hydroxysteroid dehydrogenase type 2 isoform X2 [Centropristis striata]|uniref:11-beta-hydroxysteroid dehydrogenase type 2 isoform X2 n=1 Tax=Centropristis striata TaxID=184440 RepID=UPI0027DF0719|nr:11-beta-hydroxysteroid dehydrogenase type 2 isoform X2 [Centropristis striata]